MHRVATIAALTIMALPWSSAFAFAADGSLSLSPENGTFAVGDTFDVQIVVDSGARAVNAAEADISFDPHSLSVESISTDGSIIGSWPTQPHFSNTDGTIQFSGWTKERFTSSRGLLLTISFRALQVASSPVTFTSGSVLAAEAQETNVLSSMRSGLFVLQPKIIPARAPVVVAVPVPAVVVVATTTASTAVEQPAALEETLSASEEPTVTSPQAAAATLSTDGSSLFSIELAVFAAALGLGIGYAFASLKVR